MDYPQGHGRTAALRRMSYTLPLFIERVSGVTNGVPRAWEVGQKPRVSLRAYLENVNVHVHMSVNVLVNVNVNVNENAGFIALGTSKVC